MSRTLARLRQALDDQLLVRDGTGSPLPTPVESTAVPDVITNGRPDPASASPT
jgi:hypothetical protein